MAVSVQTIFHPVLQSYSPKNVIVVAGTFLITQWNKLTIKYDDPLWRFDVGCYAQTVRRKVNNPLGTITMELPQTAQGNMYNSTYTTIFDDILQINAITPIIISNLWGQSLHVMINACVSQFPDVSYDATPQNRSWIFKGEMDINLINK